MLTLTKLVFTTGLICQIHAALTKSNWRPSNKLARDLLPAGLTGDSYNAAMSAWQASAEAFVKGTQAVVPATAPLQTTPVVSLTIQTAPNVVASAGAASLSAPVAQTYQTAQTHQTAQTYQTTQTYQTWPTAPTTLAVPVNQTTPAAQTIPATQSVPTTQTDLMNEVIATNQTIPKVGSVPTMNMTFTTRTITEAVPITTTTTSDTPTLQPPPGVVASPTSTTSLSSTSSIFNPYAKQDWHVFTAFNSWARLTELPTEVAVATPTDFATWTTSLTTTTWEKDARPTDWTCNGCTISDGWKPERTIMLVYNAQETMTLGYSGRQYLAGRLFDFKQHTTALAA